MIVTINQYNSDSASKINTILKLRTSTDKDFNIIEEELYKGRTAIAKFKKQILVVSDTIRKKFYGKSKQDNDKKQMQVLSNLDKTMYDMLKAVDNMKQIAVGKIDNELNVINAEIKDNLLDGKKRDDIIDLMSRGMVDKCISDLKYNSYPVAMSAAEKKKQSQNANQILSELTDRSEALGKVNTKINARSIGINKKLSHIAREVSRVDLVVANILKTKEKNSCEFSKSLKGIRSLQKNSAQLGDTSNLLGSYEQEMLSALISIENKLNSVEEGIVLKYSMIRDNSLHIKDNIYAVRAESSKLSKSVENIHATVEVLSKIPISVGRVQKKIAVDIANIDKKIQKADKDLGDRDVKLEGTMNKQELAVKEAISFVNMLSSRFAALQNYGKLDKRLVTVCEDIVATSQKYERTGNELTNITRSIKSDTEHVRVETNETLTSLIKVEQDLITELKRLLATGNGLYHKQSKLLVNHLKSNNSIHDKSRGIKDLLMSVNPELALINAQEKDLQIVEKDIVKAIEKIALNIDKTSIDESKFDMEAKKLVIAQERIKAVNSTIKESNAHITGNIKRLDKFILKKTHAKSSLRVMKESEIKASVKKALKPIQKKKKKKVVKAKKLVKPKQKVVRAKQKTVKQKNKVLKTGKKKPVVSRKVKLAVKPISAKALGKPIKSKVILKNVPKKTKTVKKTIRKKAATPKTSRKPVTKFPESVESPTTQSGILLKENYQKIVSGARQALERGNSEEAKARYRELKKFYETKIAKSVEIDVYERKMLQKEAVDIYNQIGK